MAEVIKVEIPEIDSLVKNFAAAPVALKETIRKDVQLSAVIAQREARIQAPNATGELIRSIEIEVMGLQALVGSRKNYAEYVEKGTKPHVILPVRKKALYWKGADHPVMSVNHPGTAPNPFMGRAARITTPIIKKMFHDDVKKFMDKIQ